jgi:alpha/beta superfamily hydrolase
MPEVIFNGPAGRLEGRYQPGKEKNAPIAIVLHPHPQFGGTMNNPIVHDLSTCSSSAVFRCSVQLPLVGRSQGCSTMAQASFQTRHPALDWMQGLQPEAKTAGWPAIPSAPGSACSS